MEVYGDKMTKTANISLRGCVLTLSDIPIQQYFSYIMIGQLSRLQIFNPARHPCNGQLETGAVMAEGRSL